MSDKACSKCGRLLPLERYHWTSGRGKRYRRADCPDCVAFRKANWWLRNRIKQRPIRTAYARTWRARNRDTYNQSQRRKRIARVLRRVTARAPGRGI